MSKQQTNISITTCCAVGGIRRKTLRIVHSDRLCSALAVRNARLARQLHKSALQVWKRARRSAAPRPRKTLGHAAKSSVCEATERGSKQKTMVILPAFYASQPAPGTSSIVPTDVSQPHQLNQGACARASVACAGPGRTRPEARHMERRADAQRRPSARRDEGTRHVREPGSSHVQGRRAMQGSLRC